MEGRRATCLAKLVQELLWGLNNAIHVTYLNFKSYTETQKNPSLLTKCGKLTSKFRLICQRRKPYSEEFCAVPGIRELSYLLHQGLGVQLKEIAVEPIQMPLRCFSSYSGVQIAATRATRSRAVNADQSLTSCTGKAAKL